MKILFNLTISAAVAMVIVVSSVNAKTILPNPVVDDQSWPVKQSAKQSSDISFPISHIDAVVKSTTEAIANTILVGSPANTTTVTSSGNTTMETSASNNITTITFVEETTKPTAARMKSNEEMTLVQATTIASVETITEKNTFTNQTTTESGDLITRYVINLKIFTESPPSKCKSDETKDANGNCKKLF